jgi:purine-binding chemotaxis protein CheW
MAERERQQESEEQLVVFELAKEVYGLDIAKVQEIIRMQEITNVPRAPRFVEGVINLRGKIIPIIDMRKRFDLEASDHSPESRIIVVEIGTHTIGMIVDGVSEVLRIPTSVIEPPSPVVTTVDSEYLRGIAKLENRLIILLDLDKVLSYAEKRSLEEAPAA